MRKTSPNGRDDLTVAEAAALLGTSAQTVRKLLRDGDLSGRKQAWGRRFVWIASRKGVDELLARHGRLDGRRRATAPALATPRAFLRRPRARATLAVVVLGVPLLGAYAAVRILPDALWFREVGQLDVYRRVAAAKAELWLLAAVAVAVFLAANLVVAAARAGVARTPAVRLGIAVAAVVAATFFGSSAARHWQAFLLWRHGQPFGVTDPVSGEDAGFFVFALPFQLAVAGLLLRLVAVAAVAVAVVYRARGALGFRPLRASPAAQAHLAALAAAFLLVVAWRLRLERYVLELGQPSPADRNAFAGDGYVDVHVRSPGLAVLSALALVAALACVVAPPLARSGRRRAARWTVAVPFAALFVTLLSVASWLPAVVQRFAVDPNPLLSEAPFLQRSIAATRSGLGLAAIEAHPYVPRTLRPADVRRALPALANVSVWDRSVLEARMRDLVTETPYFRPATPTVDRAPRPGGPRLTVAGARELDLDPVGPSARSWASDRLTYTHGLGLVRYSATGIGRHGQPRLLDAGLGVRQPRIYVGAFPRTSPSWVLANTRRPEADLPTADPYHYDGPAGIELSSWIQRAVFALGLGSKSLLISDDVTPESRIVLHRDVRDRLATLAPFIRWDSHPAPLALDGRIVFVVDGYTTSDSYPDAERVDLAGTPVSYARASVRATVDAFSGRVALYLTGADDPVARAWAAAFPTLFRPPEALPAALRERLRYPRDLFETQATAYERFHATRPDVFASGSDAWAPPTSLSGPLDVAGDIQFDEDDEDDLRHVARPGYRLAPPPGRTRPRLVLSTIYSPRRGQNLVGSLDGWVDGRGRPHLGARVLPRDPITLGPAQVSRLVFATPRVSNLLGLTNLELRDLDKNSLDTVSLGTPRLVFLPRGIVQVQSLYKGASGPGVSRMIGVTAFVNGRAAVGSDVADAVRQALHQPPRSRLLRPSGPLVVGSPVTLRFRVAHARREAVTITSPAGVQHATRSVEAGWGGVAWVPSARGVAHVRVRVEGLDGSTVTRRAALRVLRRPPTVRLIRAPSRAVVGRRVTFTFDAARAVEQRARISTREGTFTRRYLIRDGTGLIEWTPTQAGRAVVDVRARGRDGQTAADTARVTVVPARGASAPAVTLVRVPRTASVGREAEIAFRVTGSRSAVARIEGAGGDARVWRFARAAGSVAFGWTPTRPGRYRLVVSAQSRRGTVTRTATRLIAERTR